MTELYNKKENKKEWIYAIEDDSNGYPKFLIRRNSQWVWNSAKHYIPLEEWLEINKTNDKELFYKICEKYKVEMANTAKPMIRIDGELVELTENTVKQILDMR